MQLSLRASYPQNTHYNPEFWTQMDAKFTPRRVLDARKEPGL
jgi:hypothetical protein